MKELAMNSPRRLTNVLLALVAAMLLVMSSRHSQAAPQNPPSGPVTVVNTTANPVPVAQQGTTQVSGNVNVSGTVNVGNSPTVQVGNGSANPVPVAPQGTQDVNIVGGTVNVEPPVATKARSVFMPPTNSSGQSFATFEPIDASLVTASQYGPGLVTVVMNGPIAGHDTEMFSVGTLEGVSTIALPLSQKVRLDRIDFFCSNAVNSCDSPVTVNIVGN
jgi:hypothetical protein